MSDVHHLAAPHPRPSRRWDLRSPLRTVLLAQFALSSAAQAEGPRAHRATLDLATAAADVAPDAGPANPLLDLFLSLAHKTVALKNVIDPARGLTTIEYIESLPGDHDQATKPVISNRHQCGTALEKALPGVLSDFDQVIMQYNVSADMVTCDHLSCDVAGAEYVPAMHFYFAAAPKGSDRPTLEAVAIISEAALGPEWLDKAQTYVDKSLSAARAKPCGTAKSAKKAP